ncbi:MAG TPA: SRPBCC domain-containing protein [Gaiellaceae bacterium]|jgi:uncharacterized protein YndB with AHSA1/START domain
MESTTERLEIRREVEIAASPETVWELLVDPEKATAWWGRVVTLELHVGGRLRIEVTARSVAAGTVVEVDPPRRLVYTFGWEAGGGGPDVLPAGSSTVEIDLIPAGSGTTLRLVHTGLPDEAAAGQHGAGWDHYLGRLAVAAEGGDPGPDPWAASATENESS